MITAREARTLTDSSDARLTKAMEHIEAFIKDACSSGNTYVYLDEPLSSASISGLVNQSPLQARIIDVLRTNGYMVRTISHSEDIEYFSSVYLYPNTIPSNEARSIKVSW